MKSKTPPTPLDTAASRELERKASKAFPAWMRRYLGGSSLGWLDEKTMLTVEAAFVGGAKWQALDEIDALRARVAELEESLRICEVELEDISR